jgi:hypothetical protein
VIDGPGDRGAASEGFGTYMMMLLVGAPVLIDDPFARRLLERPQYLGGVTASTPAAIDRSPDGGAMSGDRLDDVLQQLESAAAPFLQLRSPGTRDSIQRIGATAEE